MIDVDLLPATSGIYRVWHEGQVVYVGQTTNLRKRWKNHHIYPSLFKAYGMNWKLDFVEVTLSNLNRAEAFAYRHFNPVLNKQNPSSMLGRTEALKTQAK